MNLANIFFADVRFTIDACAERGGYTPRLLRTDRERMREHALAGRTDAARYFRDKARILSQRARSAKGEPR